MKKYNSYPSSGASLSRTIKSLILVNVGVFILINILPKVDFLHLFGLVPYDAWSKFRIWQLLSYMFLHASLGHLFINMLMLWFFAPAIERSWGSKEFLKYYFFTGIAAGLSSIISSWGSLVPVIGASGAIFGILVAYALMFPDTVILLFFIFPIKIRHAVLLLAAVNLLGALSSPGAGIAYFAHLGGGLFGYLYLKNEWIKRKLNSWNLSSLIALKNKKVKNRQDSAQQTLNSQVDVILDQISKRGLKSLNEEQKRMLKRKSEST